MLVIERSRKDERALSRVLHSLRVETITSFADSKHARSFLEEALHRNRERPDLILIGLDSTVEGVLEDLLFYKTHPKLQECRILVWTRMEQTESELHRLFGVQVVLKQQGEARLFEVLSKVATPFTQAAGAQ